MKHYRHLLFDLDHTLWDFDKNATETLYELYDTHQLSILGNFSEQQFCDTFVIVNRALWKQYDQGAYDQQRLRSERFSQILIQLGVAADRVPTQLADDYLRICPTKPHVMPHTVATLDYLRQHYQLHILTNGFAAVQAIKLRSAGLTDYFTEVVSSDTTGHRKPHRPVFDYLLDRIGAGPQECLMIGDNLETDVRGAREAGIDQVFYNPRRIRHSEAVTHEVTCLSELRSIL
ncbi:MAG: YjjG family noncanonical pyrimidine nucleotidase [Tunicatimonas sp.]